MMNLNDVAVLRAFQRVEKQLAELAKRMDAVQEQPRVAPKNKICRFAERLRFQWPTT